MQEVTGTVDQVIAGRYRLAELIGQGGMGCVWRARHLSLGTPVAIKLVRPSVAERPGMLDRFLREAKAAALLRGTHVVQILDHGVDGGAPFIAMEYLAGESLAARLRRERKLGAVATLLVMTGVARALARAHKNGIIHRDLKPDNIFIARDEGREIAKVLDFGIAKVMEPLALDSQERKSTETGTMLGTPCYMSPEQARGRKELDARSDLWSFAVIAFECVTGRRPFDADALGELMMQICSEPVPRPSSIAKVPAGFDAWFERATQRDPAARHPSIREQLVALSEVLAPGQAPVDVTGDGETAVDPAAATAPITPFEIQSTVAANTPEVAERTAGGPVVTPTVPPLTPTLPQEAPRREEAPDQARERARRRLLVAAGVAVVAAAIGIVAYAPWQGGDGASQAAESAAAQGPPAVAATAGAGEKNTASEPGKVALPVSDDSASIATTKATTATAIATSAASPPRTTAGPVAAPPAKATAVPSAAPGKAPPAASKAELPREEFD